MEETMSWPAFYPVHTSLDRLRVGVLRPLNSPNLEDFEFSESFGMALLNASVKAHQKFIESSAPQKLGAGGANTRQRSQLD
jgi:hypothetical protein